MRRRRVRFFIYLNNPSQQPNIMDKFLIVGLGNPGAEYDHTRHNTGFMVVDELAKSVGASFEDKRYGFVAETSLKGRKVFILKPTTYMNLSGNAVRYWLQKENIDQTRLLVVVDDLSIPLGDFRLKGNGSNGGHNGLGNIQTLQPSIDLAVEIIKSFVLAGLNITMNQFNKLGKKHK